MGFYIDEKDPEFLKLKEQLNKVKIDKSNKSIDNNEENEEIKIKNFPNENENYNIQLKFYFRIYDIVIQCKSNDIIRDVIKRVESKFSWWNISKEIMYIYKHKRLIGMDISIKNIGFINNDSILMIDTHDIMYC